MIGRAADRNRQRVRCRQGQGHAEVRAGIDGQRVGAAAGEVEDLVDRRGGGVEGDGDVGREAHVVLRVADRQLEILERDEAGDALARDVEEPVRVRGGMRSVLEREGAELDREVGDRDLDRRRPVSPQGALERDTRRDGDAGDAQGDDAARAEHRAGERDRHRARRTGRDREAARDLAEVDRRGAGARAVDLHVDVGGLERQVGNADEPDHARGGRERVIALGRAGRRRLHEGKPELDIGEDEADRGRRADGVRAADADEDVRVARPHLQDSDVGRRPVGQMDAVELGALLERDVARDVDEVPDRERGRAGGLEDAAGEVEVGGRARAGADGEAGVSAAGGREARVEVDRSGDRRPARGARLVDRDRDVVHRRGEPADADERDAAACLEGEEALCAAGGRERGVGRQQREREGDAADREAHRARCARRVGARDDAIAVRVDPVRAANAEERVSVGRADLEGRDVAGLTVLRRDLHRVALLEGEAAGDERELVDREGQRAGGADQLAREGEVDGRRAGIWPGRDRQLAAVELGEVDRGAGACVVDLHLDRSHERQARHADE